MQSSKLITLKNNASLPTDTGITSIDHFGDGLQIAKDKMNEKNVYFLNPSFDR